VIRAVNDNADLLRAAIASAGNDHRLGANEAPPAIISVFIGSHLTSVLEEIEKRVKSGKFDELTNADLKMDIHNKIPDLLRDNTDRNSTSPFAFTGNKFEIRAVGSTTNCASPMTVLNTIVGNRLKLFKKDVDALMKEGEKKEGAILRVLRTYITEMKPILFEGDNYSKEWEDEAKKRGLSNVRTTPHALDFLIADKAKRAFVDNHVLSEKELEARYEILNEDYTLKIQIEARLIGDLSMNHVLPAAISYQNRLIENIRGLKDVGLKKDAYQAQLEEVEAISGHINEIKKNVDAMVEERKKANKIEDASKKAKAYCDKVFPYFQPIRYNCDKLEQLVDDNLWNLHSFLSR
jgi:glutamine synthetase